MTKSPRGIFDIDAIVALVSGAFAAGCIYPLIRGWMLEQAGYEDQGHPCVA